LVPSKATWAILVPLPASPDYQNGAGLAKQTDTGYPAFQPPQSGQSILKKPHFLWWTADGLAARRNAAPGGRQFVWGGRHQRPRHPGRSAKTPPAGAERPFPPIMLSAKTEEALAAMTANLANRLTDADVSLADAAYTLQVGRKAFNHRRFVSGRTAAEAADALRSGKAPTLPRHPGAILKSSSFSPGRAANTSTWA
jgi:hypothetical protein